VGAAVDRVRSRRRDLTDRIPSAWSRRLRLFEAAKNPDGPDVRKLQRLGALGKTPEERKAVALDEVYRTVDKYLKRETYVRSYRHGDGTASRGFGFRSLLGALFLQLSDLVNAPQGHVRFCKWCREVIAFEQGEPPAADVPKGTRGKHRTHSNREYCKEKYGITNYCKTSSTTRGRRKLRRDPE
jgi:hypothetical protein